MLLILFYFQTASFEVRMSRSQATHHIIYTILIVIATSGCCLSLPIGGHVTVGRQYSTDDISYDTLVNLLATRPKHLQPEVYKLVAIDDKQLVDDSSLLHFYTGYVSRPSPARSESNGQRGLNLRKRKGHTISLGMPLRLTADYMRDLARRRDYNAKYFNALTSLAEIGK